MVFAFAFPNFGRGFFLHLRLLLEERIVKVDDVACTRLRRHRVRCFDGAGGGSWRDGKFKLEAVRLIKDRGVFALQVGVDPEMMLKAITNGSGGIGSVPDTGDAHDQQGLQTRAGHF